MARHVRRTLLWIAVVSAAAVNAGAPARSDQGPDHHNQMVIENVWATPASVGGRSILRLRIVNEGHEHARLLGAETSVAEEARIVGRIGNRETTTFSSISIRPDSALDFTTDHLWIELGPLKRPILAGESVPVELVFVRSRMHLDAHVHGADG